MKKKIIPAIVFVCSLVIFVISANLFYQMGIYVDEYNTTPSVVYGGEFWLMADWLRLVLAGIMILLSGGLLLKKGQK